MAKVTSKLQVTIPKAIADRLGIKPGDELDWSEAGEAIRVELAAKIKGSEMSVDERLRWFDQATKRQQDRDAAHTMIESGRDRGWTREELYDRGGAD